MHQKVLLITLFLLFLNGCLPSSNGNVTTKSPALNKKPVPTSTLFVTSTHVRTPSSFPLATITPSPSNRSLDSVLRIQCINVVQTLPADVRLKGSIVLEGNNVEIQSYLFHFSDMSRQDLPTPAGGFSTSPDGKWLAYKELK